MTEKSTAKCRLPNCLYPRILFSKKKMHKSGKYAKMLAINNL